MAYHCGFHGIHSRLPDRVNFDFDDFGQQCNYLFHFTGNHFETEGIDDLRQPALEVNLSLRVNSRQIASLKPAVVKSDTTDSVPFQIAASLDYIKSHSIPKTPEDLRRHDVITTGDVDSFRFECPQGTTEIPVRSALRCRTLAEVAIAVATGMGLGVVPAALFSGSAFANVLTPVLSEFHVKESTLYVLYADRKYMPFKVRAFIDLVLESGARNQEPSAKRPAKQDTGCPPPSRAAVSYSETLHTSPADCSLGAPALACCR